MKYKLIALDIDGTLLNSSHIVTNKVRESIKKCKELGVKVVLCSGRPLNGVIPYLNELNLNEDGDYVCTFNGALVQNAHTGEILSHLTLEYSDLCVFENLCNEIEVRSHFYDMKYIYTFNKDISDYTVLEAYLTKSHLNVVNLEDISKDFIMSKFLISDHPEILDKCINKIPQELHEKYNIVRSMPFYIELLNKKANKGAALKLLAKKLDINQDEIICVGDEKNDIEMIEYAGLGVAMGNAIDEIKKIANYITKTNDEDGVAHVINKFILER